MRRNGWWIAGLLVLLTNLIVLAGVARNRSGEPDAVIELTERELPIAHQKDENSGMSLRLQPGGDLRPGWFDQGKLEDLGFDCSAPPNAKEALFHYQKQLPRDGFVVLEIGGDAWKRWLDEQREEIEETERKIERGEIGKITLENQRDFRERDRLTHSRLFPVDAGHDPRALRRRYVERGRFLIIPAVFSISVDRPPDAETDRPGPARLQGFVSQLLVQRVHVRAGLARQLEPLRHRRTRSHDVDPFEKPENFEPRYAVTLKFGRRYEPWVDQIRLVD